MFDWIRGLGSSVWIALGVFAAAMTAAAAHRQKSSRDNWIAKADEFAQSDVNNSIHNAAAAQSQAKLADAKAKELVKKSQARITKATQSNATMADILDGWRNS